MATLSSSAIMENIEKNLKVSLADFVMGYLSFMIIIIFIDTSNSGVVNTIVSIVIPAVVNSVLSLSNTVFIYSVLSLMQPTVKKAAMFLMRALREDLEVSLLDAEK